MRKKIILLFCAIPLILLFNCSKPSDNQVNDPLKAVELLINNPKDRYFKSDVGYYEVTNEDDNYIYFGFWHLDQNLARNQNIIYKADKKEYYSILRKISNITLAKAEILTKNWFLNKYPEYNNDSTAIIQNIELKFSKNKISKKYITKCNGYFEFNIPKRKKSNIAGIDSINTKEKIKNFHFDGEIENGNKITSMNIY